MATLTITRPDQFANLVRRYRLIVDGKQVAAIRSGHVGDIELSPGRHRIIAALDWARSNPVEFELSADDHIVLEVGSNCTGWRIPFQMLYFTVWSDRCLFLKRAGEPTPAISLAPRFTIRGIMIVVALVALYLGQDAYEKNKHRNAILTQVQQHLKNAKQARRELAELLDRARTNPEANLQIQMGEARYQAACEERMAAAILGQDAYLKNKHRDAILTLAQQHLKSAKQARRELAELLDRARMNPEANLGGRVNEAQLQAMWEEGLAAAIFGLSGIKPPK